METRKNPTINFPTSGLAAVIVTGLLLYFNSSLTKIYLPIQIFDQPPPVSVQYEKPPETIETVEAEEFTLNPLAPPERNATPDKPIQQDTSVPIPPGNFDTPRDVDIPRFKPGIYVQPPNVTDIFKPNQVEQKPRVLRPVPPIYPYQATVNGIEGRVVLRFIVDENGKVQNPEVVKAEPEGVFEEAALAAIVKYKFIPATIGNKKVKCTAVMPVGFEIN